METHPDEAISGLPDRASRRTIRANTNLLRAFDWLINSDPGAYASVGVEASEDGPVVEVAMSDDGRFILGVPTHGLSTEQRTALTVFFRKGELSLSLSEDSQFYVLWPGKDIHGFARLVERIVGGCFGTAIDRCQITRANEMGLVSE